MRGVSRLPITKVYRRLQLITHTHTHTHRRMHLICSSLLVCARGWISNKSLVAFDAPAFSSKLVEKSLSTDQHYLEALVEACRIARHGPVLLSSILSCPVVSGSVLPVCSVLLCCYCLCSYIILRHIIYIMSCNVIPSHVSPVSLSLAVL